jgi:hypothetical protein
MSLANRPSTTGGVSDVIGIDLGTTNSVVAMMRYGHVEVISSAEGLSLWFKLSSVAHSKWKFWEHGKWPSMTVFKNTPFYCDFRQVPDTICCLLLEGFGSGVCRSGGYFSALHQFGKHRFRLVFYSHFS